MFGSFGTSSSTPRFCAKTVGSTFTTCPPMSSHERDQPTPMILAPSNADDLSLTAVLAPQQVRIGHHLMWRCNCSDRPVALLERTGWRVSRVSAHTAHG